jgi:hypothetical protein
MSDVSADDLPATGDALNAVMNHLVIVRTWAALCSLADEMEAQP